MHALSNTLSSLASSVATLFRAPASLSRLPPRVADIVRAQDRASEHLIIAVQFALAAALAVLYLLAPRPLDAPMRLLAPVPVALMAYALFTVVRFAMSRRGPLPGWFIIPTIMTDVVLLIGLVWSFHLEYGQPPAFSLKAPSFAYLFVFIVLRALRFDHRYVLAAGLSAALGWAFVTGLAVLTSSEDTITRSFVAYLTGNRILIGAEIDKIVAILIVTAVLTAGAWRAQQTLIAAVREEAAVTEIRRFLSKGVADQISGAQVLIEAGQAAERDAAVLMLDIRGFTPFAMRVPPTEVVRMLTSFHARIIPIVRANGGVIDKFLGDGVMATFGAVEPSLSAAADVCRALDAVMDEAKAWQRSLDADIGETLYVNAAAAAGRLVFATLGDGDRLEYTVIGEAANLAAKLEKHNKVEKTRALVPASTLALAISQGYRPSGEPKSIHCARVAGVSEPIDLVGWPA